MFVSILDLVFPLYLKATLWCIKTLQAFLKMECLLLLLLFFLACDIGWYPPGITTQKKYPTTFRLFVSVTYCRFGLWTISDLLCVSMLWAGTSQKVIRQLTCYSLQLRMMSNGTITPPPPLYLCFSYSQWWKVSEFNECWIHISPLTQKLFQ